MNLKFAVSNLAWPVHLDVLALELLPSMGVNGIEIAPTKIADWSNLTARALADFRQHIKDAGLLVSSLQAILFNLPSLQLLDDMREFKGFEDHFLRLAEIANMLGATILVFGSPKNRKLCGLSNGDAWKVGLERMDMLGSIADSAGLIIGVEPVPTYYGNEFLTSWRQVLSFVDELKNPGVRVHLDTGCVAMNGDSIVEAITSCADVMCHFQVAQPHLTDFAKPHPDHLIAAKALRKIEYSRWISLEMQESKCNSIDALKEAIKFVNTSYL
jgi:sugar phosphate isomerase/epimerase